MHVGKEGGDTELRRASAGLFKRTFVLLIVSFFTFGHKSVGFCAAGKDCKCVKAVELV